MTIKSFLDFAVERGSGIPVKPHERVHAIRIKGCEHAPGLEYAIHLSGALCGVRQVMHDCAQHHSLEIPRRKRETFDIADDRQWVTDVEAADAKAVLLEKARKHARAATEVSHLGSWTQPAERQATRDNFLIGIGSEGIIFFSLRCRRSPPQATHQDTRADSGSRRDLPPR